MHRRTRQLRETLSCHVSLYAKQRWTAGVRESQCEEELGALAAAGAVRTAPTDAAVYGTLNAFGRSPKVYSLIRMHAVWAW